MKKNIFATFVALTPLFSLASTYEQETCEVQRRIAMPPAEIIQGAITQLEVTSSLSFDGTIKYWSYVADASLTFDGLSFNTRLILPGSTGEEPIAYDMANLVVHPLDPDAEYQQNAASHDGWRTADLMSPDYKSSLGMSAHDHYMGASLKYTLGDIAGTLLVNCTSLSKSSMSVYIPVITADFVGFEADESLFADVEAFAKETFTGWNKTFKVAD